MCVCVRECVVCVHECVVCVCVHVLLTQATSQFIHSKTKFNEIYIYTYIDTYIYIHTQDVAFME